MIMFQFLPEALNYIVSAPFFWQSVGFSIATAMFIGAAIFNGDVSKLTKAVITLLSYSFYLFLVTATRVTDVGINNGGFGIEHPNSGIYAHAGLFTIVIMTIAYVFGMYLGVIVVRITKKGKKVYEISRR